MVNKYYINESIYNNKSIEKIMKNNKPISIVSFNNQKINPDVRYIYSAERNSKNLNIVEWKYIDNNNCITGKNICGINNELQNLMDSTNNKMNTNEIKNIRKRNLI